MGVVICAGCGGVVVVVVVAAAAVEGTASPIDELVE